MELIVENPGLLTTIQDEGRFGYLSFGMSSAGPMDPAAFRIANILVGNDHGESALEATIFGPTIRFEGEEGLLALTGADMGATLNGRPCPRYQAVPVKAGDQLRMGAVTSGARAYIAVSGGIDVPLIMGSRSTAVQNRVGGFEGRKLMAGDRLPGGIPRYLPADPDPRHSSAPEYPGAVEIRVIPGPQQDAFTAAGLVTFYGSEFTIGADSNRMGCRLDGPLVEHAGDGNIISDGIVPGCIQVPGSGQPIVLLQDCQTVGGYAKIATVVAADLGSMGQLKPGDRVRFRAVSLEEAHAAYLNQEKTLYELDAKFNHSWAEAAVHRIGQFLSGKTVL